MTEPTTLAQRLADLIGAAEQANGVREGYNDPDAVAAAILADTELVAEIAELHTRNATGGLITVEQRLTALDLTADSAIQFPSSFGSGRLISDLSSLRDRLERRRSEDTEFGATFTRLGEPIVGCVDHATIGALVRATVEATGSTITPAPRNADREISETADV